MAPGHARIPAVLLESHLRGSFAGAALARLGASMLPLSLLLLGHDRSGGFGTAGALVAVVGLAAAATGPALGRLVDRRGPRVLAVTAVLHLIALVCLVNVDNFWLWPCSVVAGGAIPPVGAALRGRISRALPDADLMRAAYGLDAILTEITFVVGPSTVGVCVALAAPAASVILSGGLALVGATTFVLARDTSGASRGSEASGTEDVRRPWGRLLPVLVVAALQMSAIAFVEVGLTAFAVEQVSPAAAGPILAAWAAGSLVGGALYTARHWPGTARAQAISLLILGAVGFTGLLLAVDLATVVPLAVVAGLSGAPIAATLSHWCGSATAAGDRTAGFALLASVSNLAGAGGYLLAGGVVQSTNERVAIGIAAGLVAVAVPVVLQCFPNAAKRAPTDAATGS